MKRIALIVCALALLTCFCIPAQAAQEVCNLLYDSGVKTMWCFAPRKLYQPADAVIRYENMALSLAHLKMQSREAGADTEEA